ncbi:MAG: hypothetical protein HGA45_17440 [Chloroflexales bacterium]|nr:hypothetical protein [Chloroflexales bacterium]
MAERIVWVVAVVLVGAAAFFVGQQMGVQSGMQRRAQATQQFFAERGGQGAGAAQSGGPGAGALQGTPGIPGRGQGVMGTVERVEGDQIIITTFDGTSVTVRLAKGGSVRKQVDGQLSDVQPGERVVVIGARDGDTVEATSVQVGGGFGGGRPTSAP